MAPQIRSHFIGADSTSNIKELDNNITRIFRFVRNFSKRGQVQVFSTTKSESKSNRIFFWQVRNQRSRTVNPTAMQFMKALSH
jgi:hypothetical protein